MPLNPRLLGTSGCGKGTQAKALADRRKIEHLSTGDLFRAAIREGTPVGKEAQSYLDQGLLVPDDVVCRLVREKLETEAVAAGFILDGFPRTTGQAESLDEDLDELGRKLTAVVYFHVDDDVVTERLGGRETCQNCGAMYHKVHNPPKVAGVCDACGGTVAVRKDDQEDTIRKRLSEYQEKTAPLRKFYENKGLLRTVDAGEAIETVQATLESALGDG